MRDHSKPRIACLDHQKASRSRSRTCHVAGSANRIGPLRRLLVNGYRQGSVINKFSINALVLFSYSELRNGYS